MENLENELWTDKDSVALFLNLISVTIKFVRIINCPFQINLWKTYSY